jgi:ABC-type uncharacterized transport system involved in gliding motility auxiliary subunit
MGKAFWLIGALFLIGTGIGRLAFGSFHPSFYVSLGLGLILIVVAIAKDFTLYSEFFGMRTTKNGLAMGWLIVLAFILVFCVNYLSVRFDKTWDVSSDGFNSLSPQSVQVVKSIHGEIDVVLLFHKEQQQPQEADIRRTVQDLVQLYKNKNSNIKLESFEALSRPDLAQKYDFKTGAYGLYIEAQGKHLQVDAPTEEAMTKTLLRLTKDKKKIFYFTQGHGERSLTGETPQSISFYATELGITYEVKPLTLFEQNNKVPDNADALAIVGPEQEFLPPELAAVREYARKGGHILIAADSGAKHNMAQLMKTFGVEFRNNFVLDPRATVPGAGNVAALGSVYSQTNDITKGMGANVSFFLLASALRKAPDAPASIKLDDLVSTNMQSYDASTLSKNTKIEGHGPHVLGIQATGTLGGKPFSVVMFGDSHFLSNQLFQKYGNRDLAMNVAASLADDKDLISIRPKTPKGSVLELHGSRLYFIVFGFLLPLPLLLLLASSVIWFRRRTA